MLPKGVVQNTRAAASSGKLLCPGGYQQCDDAERFCNRVTFKFKKDGSGGSTAADGSGDVTAMPANLQRYEGTYELRPGLAHGQRPVWQRRQRLEQRGGGGGRKDKAEDAALYLYFVDHGGLSVSDRWVWWIMDIVGNDIVDSARMRQVA
jgi:hypothetical protein